MQFNVVITTSNGFVASSLKHKLYQLRLIIHLCLTLGIVSRNIVYITNAEIQNN